MVRAFIVLSLAVTFYFALEAKAEECNRVYKGCKVEGTQCVCGKEMACENPWKYRNALACSRDQFGDPCYDNPCQHEGTCVQHKKQHARCQCAGTGYYGDVCETKCPETEAEKLMSRLDDACVIP